VKEHVVMLLCMCTNAVVTSGVLQVHFLHDFCNMICKGKGKGHPRTGDDGPEGE